jgi:hypothetical protein
MAIGDLVFFEGNGYIITDIQPDDTPEGIELGYSDWVTLFGDTTIHLRMEDLEDLE